MPSKEQCYRNILNDLENVENKKGHIAKESIAETAARWNALSKSDFKEGYQSALEDFELYFSEMNDTELVLKKLRKMMNQ